MNTVAAPHQAPTPPAAGAAGARRQFTVTTRRAVGDGSPHRSAFRGDIEGLRAVAVGLVVLWHGSLPGIKGGFVGVDVFYVISGFLMTGILLRELQRDGTIDISNFVRRRFRRLLPASLLTLAVTCLAALFILPRGRWWGLGMDALSASTYVSNWHFAASAVDYLAQDTQPSPLQHFWSLSVEEQYYVVWPLALLVLAGTVRVTARGARRLVLVATLVIFVVSLAWSMRQTITDPGVAYFSTATRAWELALGGALSVLAPTAARLPRLLAAGLAWLGLIAVCLTGALLPTTYPFPGWIALVPALGTALVLAFAPVDGRGPAKVLSLKPLAWIGSISYSLYLWHWPVLVLGAQFLAPGSGVIPVWQSMALAVTSILPAWLSLKFVENPTRRSEWLAQPVNTWMAGLTAMAVAVMGSGALALRGGHPVDTSSSLVSIEDLAQQLGTSGSRAKIEIADGFGAQALGNDPRNSKAGEPVDEVETITPDPANAAQDTALTNSTCHAWPDDPDYHACQIGQTQLAAAAEKVVLVGDSHAGQWAPAIRLLARNQGWNLFMATKSACPLNDVTITRADGSDYPECAQWNAAALDALTGADKPDLVFLSNSNYEQTAAGGTEGMAHGLIKTYERLVKAGIHVVVLRDTPQSTQNVAECADANRTRLAACAFSREDGLARRDHAQQVAIDAVPKVKLIDLTDAICPADQCAPVIGGVLVWRDSNHMTDTYSRTLAPRLVKALKLS